MRLHPAEPEHGEVGPPDEMPPVTDIPEPRLPFSEAQAEDELPPEKRPLP
jgi:hypothetical protein